MSLGTCEHPDCREFNSYLAGHGDALELAAKQAQAQAQWPHNRDGWLALMSYADELAARARSLRAGDPVCLHPVVAKPYRPRWWARLLALLVAVPFWIFCAVLGAWPAA